MANAGSLLRIASVCVFLGPRALLASIGRLAGLTGGVVARDAVFVAASSIIGTKLWAMAGETE
jgi:hypothetical protein